MRRALLASLFFSITTSLAGCNEPSKSSSPPARTYGAPSTKVKGHDEYSSPYGVNGNPYYFNQKTEKWVYFDENGRERESLACPRIECSLGQPVKEVAGREGAQARDAQRRR